MKKVYVSLELNNSDGSFTILNLGYFSLAKAQEWLKKGRRSRLWAEIVKTVDTFYCSSELITMRLFGAINLNQEVHYLPNPPAQKCFVL